MTIASPVLCFSESSESQLATNAKKLFGLQALVETKNEADARRSMDSTNSKEKSRNIDTFAYHDKMESEDAGDLEEFQRNLKAYEAPKSSEEEDRRSMQKLVDHLHGTSGRRSGQPIDTADAVKDILLHYAVPIDVTINGYIQLPVEELESKKKKGN